MTRPADIEVYWDGCCWPNPGGRAAYGYVVRVAGGQPDAPPVHIHHGDVGRGAAMTNNVAEYAGLVAALEWLLSNGYADAHITARGDSRLVVEQMAGRWHVRGGCYLDQHIKARNLADEFKCLRFQWIPRAQNAEADAVASGHMCGPDCWCKVPGALILPPNYVRKRHRTPRRGHASRHWVLQPLWRTQGRWR